VFKGEDPSSIPAEYEELEREFCRLTGSPYPVDRMAFAHSWMFLRVSSSS
jgi:hypothetical protein